MYFSLDVLDMLFIPSRIGLLPPGLFFLIYIYRIMYTARRKLVQAKGDTSAATSTVGFFLIFYFDFSNGYRVIFLSVGLAPTLEIS